MIRKHGLYRLDKMISTMAAENCCRKVLGIDWSPSDASEQGRIEQRTKYLAQIIFLKRLFQKGSDDFFQKGCFKKAKVESSQWMLWSAWVRFWWVLCNLGLVKILNRIREPASGTEIHWLIPKSSVKIFLHLEQSEISCLFCPVESYSSQVLLLVQKRMKLKQFFEQFQIVISIFYKFNLY